MSSTDDKVVIVTETSKVREPSSMKYIDHWEVDEWGIRHIVMVNDIVSRLDFGLPKEVFIEAYEKYILGK